MRVEEKSVDGDNARQLGRRVGAIGNDLDITDELLHDERISGAELVSNSATTEQIVAAVEAIFAGREIDEIQRAAMSPEHHEALRLLELAVSGRDDHHVRLVFADDRRDMLEQALATLQPELAHCNDGGAMAGQFQHVVEQVDELRTTLHQLTDAQYELHHEPVAVIAREGDDDDKPAGEDEDEDEDEDQDDGETSPPRESTR